MYAREANSSLHLLDLRIVSHHHNFAESKFFFLTLIELLVVSQNNFMIIDTIRQFIAYFDNAP
jgi:hypothetical protein